ncbi:MAG: hypothetical protein RR367_01005, partial [Clostridia bacterium]
PAALVLAAAVVIFVIGQLSRNDQMWIVTTALTIVSGGYFVFLYGVYVRPMRLYRKHVDYMLNGRKRETTGVLKDFAADTSDKEGVECYAMLLNVGERDDEEDDRLFYYDVHKPKPTMPLGSCITVTSNDRMVADVKLA